MPEDIATTTPQKWCRFCKHFLPQGLLLRETPFYNEVLSRDSCEKWRDYCFKPFSCKDARGSEDMCGAAGRNYQECEDRWMALGPALQAIENYKNRNQSKKPPKRSWWKRLLGKN